MDRDLAAITADMLIDIPGNISAQELIGEMPEGEEILKEGTLMKLTSQYEWKPMRAVLTDSFMCLARKDEERLRDKIPLSEILDFRKRHDVPRFGDDENRTTQKISKLSSLMENENENSNLHIIQIRTKEDGYNSGRTYYFNTEDEETCNGWIRILRPACDEALLRLNRSGPSFLFLFQLKCNRFYRSMLVQGFVAVLIFLSFLSNIVQTELQFDDGSEAANKAQEVYDKLELFFTLVFAVELCINIMANFFWPFVSDPWFPPPGLSHPSLSAELGRSWRCAVQPAAAESRGNSGLAVGGSGGAAEPERCGPLPSGVPGLRTARAHTHTHTQARALRFALYARARTEGEGAAGASSTSSWSW